ncbi:MAG: DUF4258 domain-containing protein [Candidatus Woesearchaeota archaeon]|nr:DUF4258 domain-containing protein [Candidatus Woesearchaeota archaeon]
MKITYTDYAEETLLDRKIDKKDVEDAILHPTEVIDGKKDRKIAHKLFGEKLLRVIFEIDDIKTYIVITAYFTHPARYTNDEN